MDYDIGTKIVRAKDIIVRGLCDSSRWIVRRVNRDAYACGGGTILLADADWDDATFHVTYDSSKYKHEVYFDDFLRALDAGVLEIAEPPHTLEALGIAADA